MKRHCLIRIMLILLVCITLMSVGCNNARYTGYTQVTEDNGLFKREESEAMISEYIVRTNEGFCLSIDFVLTNGKVEWQLINPNDDVIYTGYCYYEDGKTFRQLTYSYDSRVLDSPLGQLQEVVEVDEVEFGYLQIDHGNIAGKYKIVFTPTDAEGSYRVNWHAGLPKK